MINKTGFLMAIFCVVLFLNSIGLCESPTNKEELVEYIKEVSSIITNVEITIRNIGAKTLPMGEGVKRMDAYISQMEFVKYPKELSRQYTMIKLSFKKFKTALTLFSLKNTDTARKVVKSGADLLKYAAKDIVAIAEKEGLRKVENKTD